jgi:hypothetical protein
MRIQHQKGVQKRGTGVTFEPSTIINADNPRKGVTYTEFIAGLKSFQNNQIAARNVRGNLEFWFVIAVRKTEKWATDKHEGGGIGAEGGQVHTEPFPPDERDPDYKHRVDVDNLRGHQNLKERF